MKRVTILFDDEGLYQTVKAEAAKEGRSVKDVVAEALGGWLSGRARLSPRDRERPQAALNASDELRSTVPLARSIDDTIDELRNERS